MSGFVTLPLAILASSVAIAGTYTAAYPALTDAGAFAHNKNHKLIVNGASMAYPADFTLTFGTADITVTNVSAAAWAAGSRVYLQLDKAGEDQGNINPISASPKVSKLFPVWIDLGAPDVADANGHAASQAITAAGTGTIDGVLLGTNDVPRNIVAAWTATAVMTITGTDNDGNVMVESSASGTTMAGKKAFKTVTAIDVSADVTGATVGTGDVLGIPIFIRSAGNIVAEVEDNGVATAGTIAAGNILEPTATTGDNKGTYDPDTAADGAVVLSLLALVADPSEPGLAQYAG